MKHQIKEIAPVGAEFDIDVFAATINSLYEKLNSYHDFEPTEDLVNLYATLTSTLQRDVSPETVAQVFRDQRIIDLTPKLRAKWGEAAGIFEESWSRKIVSSVGRHKALKALNSYPRLKNYRSTCPLEMGLMTTVLGRPPTKMAMIGCGPLPLTGLSYIEYAYARDLELEVLNIDIIPERVQQSQRLCELTGRTQGMRFVTADAHGSLPELADCDVVLLASVAGVTDDDKAHMVKNISKHMTPGSLILTRGSNGLSQMLYPKLDLQILQRLAPKVQPALLTIALDGPTKHDIFVLRILQ